MSDLRLTRLHLIKDPAGPGVKESFEPAQVCQQSESSSVSTKPLRTLGRLKRPPWCLEKLCMEASPDCPRMWPCP